MKSLMKPKGFSLLETLISLVILAVALLALAGLMATTTKNNSFGSHVTEASTFAQSALETLRVARWIDIANGSDSIPAGTAGNIISYNRVWTVTTQPPPPNDLLRVVNITVTWNDSKSHTIAFGPYNIMRPPGQ